MIQFPRHNAGLYLEHNAHKDIYESVEEFIDNRSYDWISEEEKELAIKNNEVWTLQWYPDTPIGFHSLAAYSLDKLLEEANKEETE